MLTLTQLAHAAEYLQREGEAWDHVLATVPAFTGPDHDAARSLEYERFLERRHELFMSIPPRFDGLAIGWHRAAVRVCGERAVEALDALVARDGPHAAWPGAEDAERLLRLLVTPA